MKLTAKRTIIALVLAICLMIGTVVLAACDQSAEQFTLTLDAGDGTLSQTEIKVEKDANMLSKVADIAPKADGVIFDCWLLNDQPLTADDKMTGNVTLKAQYKTAYKVEVYYQNEEKSNYVQDGSKTVNGFGKVGETVAPEIAAKDGFVLNTELSSDANKTLAKGENLLRYYYARADLMITYTSVGDDSEDTFEQPTYFGAVVKIADCDFAREGYSFLGWSEDLALGADLALAAGEDIEISENVTLYAQWGKNYDEAYGSGDTVAVAETASKDGEFVALLISGEDKTFGTYDTESSFFTAGEEKGKVFDENGLFLYDTTGLYLGYSLLGNASDEAYGTLALNMETGTAVYTLGSDTVNGTYEQLKLRNGKFSGEMLFKGQDTEFYFCFLDSSENPELDTDTYAGEFFRRGEEEGEYIVLDMTGGNLDTPYAYNIYLDGYGNLEFPIPAMLGVANAYGTYSGYDEEKGEWKYVYEGQMYEDTVGEYPKEFVFKAGYLKSLAGTYSELDGTVDGELLSEIPVILIYDGQLAGVYQTESGAKFEMDGYGNAVYTASANAEAIEGYVDFKGLAAQKTETGDVENKEYWDSTETVKSILFTYYDSNDDEHTMVFLCSDYIKIERESWLLSSPIKSIVEKHELVAVDTAKEAGSYSISHNEEENIEFKLDGSGNADLSLFDLSHKTSVWFATGTYEMTSDTDGEFTLTEATTSLAYLGVAAGSFKFRLSGDTFIICDESLFGNFDMQGATVVFDGFGSLTDGGTVYTYEKMGCNVLKAQDENGNVVMYTVNYNDKTVKKSQSGELVGDYLTVVIDNAVYIGPGRLMFDGNGRALFYEMEEGRLIGEGLYTYDPATNRGSFITTGEMQFFVESFDFCITTMTDSDGVVCNVYIKHNADEDVTLTDENSGDTLVLDGYGFATYSDGETEVTSKYEIINYGPYMTALKFTEADGLFSLNLALGTFSKEDAVGIYNAVYFDEENGAYMIDEYDILTLYGQGVGDYDMYEMIEYEKIEGTDDEFTVICYNEDYDVEDEFRIKLVNLPAFDDFGEQYYVDTFLKYDANKVATYTHTDGAQTATVAVDGYGDVTYTDYDGTVYTFDFWNVESNDTCIAFGGEELVSFPSRTVFAYFDKATGTYTTSKELGSYVRYYNDDLYYPQMELIYEDGQNYGILYAPQGEQLVIYAIGTYTSLGNGEYELTVTDTGAEYDSIKHLLSGDNKMKFKLTYVLDYSAYIVCDSAAKGEYTFEGQTFTLDGYGAVEISDGTQGEASRLNDVLIVEIDGTTRYFKVGDNNVLTEVQYTAYIEWIK